MYSFLSEQTALCPTEVQAKMFIGFFGSFSAAWSSHQKSFLNQERFVHFFQRARIFTNCRSNGSQSNRAAVEFFDDDFQHAVVHLIQAIFIHIQCIQSVLCNCNIDGSVAFDLCKITHSPQNGIGNSGSSTASSCDLKSSTFIYGNIQ